jgi:glucose-1-phosphate thymidylyltransferase
MSIITKGIILAGDSGSKLHPLTLGIPKPLIPVYDRPLIYLPIETLTSVGVTDILIITSPRHAAAFKEALGNGERFGAHFSYAVQRLPEGAAQAFTIAEEFVGSSPVCFITGDCVVRGKNLSELLRKALRGAKTGQATVFIQGDTDAEQYGAVELDADGKCAHVVGEPSRQFHYSIIGLGVYPKGVAECARQIQKSERGRYEITDLNGIYHDSQKLCVQMLGWDYEWFDTNSFDSMLALGNYIKTNKNQNQTIW